MENNIFEYWTQSGNTFSESMKTLTEINTKAFTTLTEQQQALVTNLSEVCAHQIPLATESKGYAELLSGQAKLAAEQREKLLAIAIRPVCSKLPGPNSPLGWKKASKP